MEKKNEKISVVISPEKNGKSDEKRSFWHVNREMLPYKLHFFLFIGGMGAVLPYHSALGILKLGLTASNLAAVFTAQQFLFILFKPAIGYIADYFNRLKATIIGLTVLQAIFCFLMIIIPNNGMPGINELQLSNISQTKPYKCHFCKYHEAFKMVVSGRYLDDDSFRQVLSCFNNTESEHVAIRCSKDYINSTHSKNGSYEIMLSTCNLPNIDFVPSLNYTSPTSLYSIHVLFITVSINMSQNSITCLLPKGKMLHSENNVSYSDIKQYCHVISDSESIELKNILLLSSSKALTCSNLKVSAPFTSVKGEHNAALSAANFKTYQFWAFAVCLILTCLCDSSIFTMSDTACYESVNSADYGRQRAWGAVSWGVIAPLAGFLNDYTDNYMASWCVMALLCTLQIWNLSRMNLVKPDFSQNILKDIKTVFSSMEFLAFEAGVLMNGMFTGVIWFYLTWFLTTIGGNKLIIGLAHTIQCFLGEVPIMFVSGWLIKKLGHFNLVSLALISHGIRFFIYSYLHNPWWILPIESLHGFTFGSFYSAMTSYGKLNSKPGTEATTQSVLCTTYEGLGAGLGCVISGICFDYYGGHATFFYASFFCAVATLINVLFTALIRCRKGGLDVTKTTSAGTERY